MAKCGIVEYRGRNDMPQTEQRACLRIPAPRPNLLSYSPQSPALSEPISLAAPASTDAKRLRRLADKPQVESFNPARDHLLFASISGILDAG